MAAYASLVSLSQTIQKIYSSQESPMCIIYHPHVDRGLFYNLQCVTDSFLAIFKNDPDDITDNYFFEYMRDEANRAEDIIEEINEKIFEESMFNKYQTKVEVESLQRDLSRICEHLYIANRIVSTVEKSSLKAEDLQLGGSSPTTSSSSKKKIWEVLQSMSNFLGFKLKSSPTTSSSSRLAPTSIGAIVGLEDNLMKIKTWLKRESFKVQVIPIVGMGGIGKTTLATNVYNDPSIMEHFDIRVWVKVSQNYDAEEFLSSLIVSNKSFDKRICERSIDEMKLHVYQTLIGRRYLVVVDDIWSMEVWDHVMNLFPDNDNGSRIILATRLLDVANYVDPSGYHHHIMHLMDEYQSWNLLQNKVFPAGITCPLELAATGFKIARSCRGLPLAIVLTAGLLSTVNQDLETWKNIARKISLHGTTEYECIKEILLLSYTNLII